MKHRQILHTGNWTPFVFSFDIKEQLMLVSQNVCEFYKNFGFVYLRTVSICNYPQLYEGWEVLQGFAHACAFVNYLAELAYAWKVIYSRDSRLSNAYSKIKLKSNESFYNKKFNLHLTWGKSWRYLAPQMSPSWVLKLRTRKK